MTLSIRMLAALGVSALVLGCDDPTQPVQTFTPNFLVAAPDAPAIANPVLSFWAVKGQEYEEFIWYQKRPDRADSTDLVRFRLDQLSLLTRPDGTPIAMGDSILITITVVDAQRMILDMQPSGLRFSSADPAELKISFLEADDDINQDGTVNASDTALVSQLAIWRRETATAPWVKLSSAVEVELDEVEADLLGFTGYAIAY